MMRVLSLLVAAPIVFAAQLALAQSDDATAKAKTLFDIGAQAYDAGNFPAALQAFQEAYRLAPRPGIVFSMAQAHRRQYYLGKRPEHLRAAVKLYREYVGRVEQGGRRAEAAQALAELEPLADRLEKTPDAAKPDPDAKPETRLMVSTKTKGATIVVDGGKPAPLPLFAEVKPGRHTLRITADGFAPEERDVEVVEGVVLPLDVPLRELPGRLVLSGVDGGQVTLDGRLVGSAPLPGPIDVPPGRHLLTLSRNGFRGYSQEFDVGRGEVKTLPVKLERTGQRFVSYTLLGVGSAGVVAGGILGGLAFLEQRRARDIDEARARRGGLPAADLKAYDDARSARDDYRRAGAIVAGAGALVGVTGLVLYLFDPPAIQGSATRSDDRLKTPGPPTDDGAMEISAAPLISPWFTGAALTGTF